MIRSLLKRNKQSNNQPVERIHSGSLGAAIWKNRSERGWRYRVTFSRSETQANGEVGYSRGFYPEDAIDFILLGFEVAEWFIQDERLPKAIRVELEENMKSLFRRDDSVALGNGFAG